MSVSTSTDTMKQRILFSLDNLPPEGLREVAKFLDYVRFKFQRKTGTSSPYRPIALGGLWKGTAIDAHEIDEVRREMWSGLENRGL